MSYEPLTTIHSESEKTAEITENNLRTSMASTLSADSIAKNKIPSRLKKTFCYSLILLIVAIILLVVGIEESIRNERFNAGMSFYILSLIVFIPGGYYCYQFLKAKISHDIESRREILENIPEL